MTKQSANIYIYPQLNNIRPERTDKQSILPQINNLFSWNLQVNYFHNLSKIWEDKSLTSSLLFCGFLLRRKLLLCRRRETYLNQNLLQTFDLEGQSPKLQT